MPEFPRVARAPAGRDSPDDEAATDAARAAVEVDEIGHSLPRSEIAFRRDAEARVVGGHDGQTGDLGEQVAEWIVDPAEGANRVVKREQLRLGRGKAERTHLQHLLFLCAIALTLFWLPWALEQLPAVGEDPKGIDRVLGLINEKRIDWGKAAAPALVFAAFVVAMLNSPRWQAMGALGMCAAVVLLPSSVRRGEAQRSFFGVYRVFESYDKQYNVLMHGTTLHGAQRIRSEDSEPVADQTPGTYYHPESPMAKTVEMVRASLAETSAAPGRYGIVGLGAQGGMYAKRFCDF